MLASVILLFDCFRIFPIIFRKFTNCSKIFLWRYGVQPCFVYQKWKITFYRFLVVISWNQLFIPAFYTYGVSLCIQFECGKMRTRITPNTDTFHTVCSRMIAYYSDLNHLLLVLAFLAKNCGFSIILESYSSRLNFIKLFYFDTSYEKFTWSNWQFERLEIRRHTSNPCRFIYSCIERS